MADPGGAIFRLYCSWFGHCWLPMPGDPFDPLLCHRCGFVIHKGRAGESHG